MTGLLAVGLSASITRHFTAADGEALRAIAGASLSAQDVLHMQIAALWSMLLGMHMPGPGANYLKQESQYLAATSREGVWAPPPAYRLSASVTITRLRPEKGLVDLDTRCNTADGVSLAQGRALLQARDTGRMPRPS